MREYRIAPAHGFQRGEIARAAAFHHVAGERPWAAGKADQRHAAVQFLPDQMYGVHDVTQFPVHVRHGESGDIGPGTHRTFKLRTFTGGEGQPQAHRSGYGENVGKQDRRVEVEALQRLQGNLAGQLRVLRQGHEAAGTFTRGAILRQVAAGLTHDPDWRGVGPFATQGAQEAVVLQISESHVNVRRGLPGLGQTSPGNHA